MEYEVISIEISLSEANDAFVIVSHKILIGILLVDLP